MNINWLREKIRWSLKTFGTDQRSEGVLRHIESEIIEVRKDPTDITEWIDIALLALDGAMRCGISPEKPDWNTAEEINLALLIKQAKNYQRKWGPLPGPDEPSFHHKE